MEDSALNRALKLLGGDRVTSRGKKAMTREQQNGTR